MKNRKTLLLFVLCLTALSAVVACTNYIDEVNGDSTSMDNSIEVNAMIGSGADAQTKVLPTSSEVTTATLTKFWLSAFKASGDTIKGTDSQKASIILSDKEFTRTDGVYSDNGTYYWPVGSITFCAVAATSGSTIAHPSGVDTIKVSKDSIYAKNFKVDTTGSLTTFQNQEDYIVAVNKTSKPSGTNKVSLTFQHILSRISINAYAPGFKTKRPYLANFAFDSVQVRGNFTFNGSSTSSPFYYKNGGTSGDKCWSAATDADTATVGSKTDVWYGNNVFKLDTVTTNKRLASGANIVPWLNVIPGSNTAHKLYLVLWYQDKKWSYTLNLDGILSEYKPGYQYIYNIYVNGNDNPEGEKVRPQVELVNITVQEWSTGATTETVETPDAANGNTLKKQIESAQINKQNLEIKLTSSVVTEVKMRDSVKVTTNIVIDLNNHTLIPVATRANGDTTAAFYVTGGHRLAFKGSGSVNVDTVKVGSSDMLKGLEGSDDTFAIRGCTWSFDPQRHVPGFDEVQSYPEIVSPAMSSSITITGPSYKYTITKTDLGTTPKTYSYTVTEDSLN